MEPNDWHTSLMGIANQGVPWYDFTLDHTHSRSPELKEFLLKMKVFSPEDDRHWGPQFLMSYMDVLSQSKQGHADTTMTQSSGNQNFELFFFVSWLSFESFDSQVSALTVDHREQWLYTSSKDNSIKAGPTDYHHGLQPLEARAFAAYLRFTVRLFFPHH